MIGLCVRTALGSKFPAPCRAALIALAAALAGCQPVGYTLQDFAGGIVPYFFPAAPRALRAGVEWAF